MSLYKHNHFRRKPLATLTAGGAVGMTDIVWVRPVIRQAILPVHAVTSGIPLSIFPIVLGFTGGVEQYEVPEGHTQITITAVGRIIIILFLPNPRHDPYLPMLTRGQFLEDSLLTLQLN